MADFTRIIPSPEAKAWQKQNDIILELLDSGDVQFSFGADPETYSDEHEKDWYAKANNQ